MKLQILSLAACFSLLLAAQPEQAGSKTLQPAHVRAAHTEVRIAPEINAVTSKDGISYSIRGRHLKIKIVHRRGIGKASIILVSGRWPTETEVAFQGFSELEGLSIEYGAHKIALSSKQPRSQQRPFDVRHAKGSILVTFPRKYLSATNQPLNLSWVDYYR